MAQNSNIEWCDHTVNLWWGCSKVHTGCKNCYAETLSNRFNDNLWGEKGKRKMIKSAFKDLNKYQDRASKEGKKTKIFMGSMMDIFEDPKPLFNGKGEKVTVPTKNGGYECNTDIQRAQLFSLIDLGQYDNLVFLFLTKRPKNISKYIPDNWKSNPPENVWFGMSISDQKTMTDTFTDFIIHSPYSCNRFLSVEPQVGHITFKDHLIEKKELGEVFLNPIHWIIQGGESGAKKRPFDLSWAYSMKKECESYGIPYFFKQIDKVQPIPEDLTIREFPGF